MVYLYCLLFKPSHSQTVMKQILKTTPPKVIPTGFRKFKYCTGKYKKTVLGREFEHDQPIWAVKRYDKNAMFAEDKEYYILYTLVNY